MNNLPSNVSSTILPVEKLLPQPSPDATALVRLVTVSLTRSATVSEELRVRLAQLLAGPSKNGPAIVDALDAYLAESREPTVWVLNHPHPLATEAKIVRMYHREDNGVEVYSSDGKMFVRTVIPENRILFFDEAMAEETFVEFIEIAEEEEDEPDDKPDPAGDQPEPPANGSTTTA